MYSQIHDHRRWLLTEALREHASSSPDVPWMTDIEGETLTFGQALAASLRAASFLSTLGVKRSDRVGVLMFNGCAITTAWLGLGQLAATAVFLNTELRGAFLRHQLNDAQLQFLVVDAELLPAIVEIAGELPHLRTVIVAGGPPAGPLPASWRVLEWRAWSTHAEWDGPGPGPQDIACIMYTSGTSGPSKGVLMPHAHCALYGVGTIRCLELTQDDRYYVCLPMFHANALLMQVGATLLAGIPVLVRRRFSASQWLPDIREHGATVTNVLGAVSGFLFSHPASPLDRQHRLRAVLSAPNLPQHEAQFRERFGVRDVVSGFGMTEVNMPIWGRLGRPAPGAAGWTDSDHFEVCIVDPETDEALPTGQMGEIVVRPRIPFGFMAGYFNAPEKTVEAWRNLWFHTGDAGTMREDGLITFVDRIKDCIRRRGENISATEVEGVVASLPGIAEVAAYAVPSDLPGGEDEVMLALVPEAGAALNLVDLMARAGERLPRFAKPRFAKVVEALPKTATGKVQRAVLRRQGVAGAVDAAKEVSA